LIFDSDGTLVDSEFLNCQALSAELAQSGIDIGARELLERYRGWQLSLELDELQQQHGTSLDPGFVDRFRDRALAMFSEQLQPIAGIVGALEQLQQPMCVASNGPVEKLQLALSVTGLDRFFGKQVFSAYEVGIFKPDPGLFRHAADAMGFRPDDCIVIEDSEVGIKGADAAGMSSVLYNPERLPIPVSGRTLEIADMADLAETLQQIANDT
jgi:HAD superfamily hydrolase (TIGR01509 family)